MSESMQEWADVVVIARTAQRGVWKIAGKVGGAKLPSVLAESADLPALRQQLADGGYRLSISTIDAEAFTGNERFERPAAPAEPAE